MNVHQLAGPVIGAVIGCFTNYIAVKMLFRPLNPIRIGSFTLPFTPGIIPRGRTRLAKAVGAAVGESLLTEESFTETLLSPAVEKRLKEKIRLFLYANRKNELTLRELLLEVIDEPFYETGMTNLTASLTDRFVARLLEADVGGLIADEAARAVRERIHGGLISFVIGDNMLNLIRDTICDEVNLYLEGHAEELIGPRVESECEAFMEMKVGALVGKIDDCGLPLDTILWDAYAALVHKKLGAALRRLDLSAMIEKKINEMDMLEVERLVLSVMKKELDAVVALGAVIGFALGLVNVFI